MTRNRLLLLLVIGLAVGAFVVIRLRMRAPAVPEAPPPPPATPPAPALQADAEGYYVPGYEFAMNRVRFTGFSLRPEALVTFVQTATGTQRAAGCEEARITAGAVHLRCDFPQVGTITIDGNFLTRVATKRLDAAVLSAVVTVRGAGGETLYSARDSFAWRPAD